MGYFNVIIIIMLSIIFGLINLAFATLILFLTLAFLTGAPFVPSTGKVTQKMVEFAHIRPGDVVYDLGSGDGRLLFAAAKLGARAIGYEINPYLVLLTNIRILFSPYRKQVKVVWHDFWGAKLADADTVFIYLLPWKMDTLANKLQKSLPAGARIVSNSFIFPKWKMADQGEKLHVYSYRIVNND
jgi:predicted RNA methylase